MYAVSAQNVTKTYGDVTALDGLSLAVERGTTFGLLGSNGAGKTTLFKLLVGHMVPDEGTVEVAGVDVRDAGTDLRRSVGYLPEHAGFPSTLTGREVLAFHGRMRGLVPGERDERIAATLETVGLADAADRPVAGYSNGMNRRLGLATALLARPSILLLDEPTAGLDPLGVRAFHDVVVALRDADDLTVVLSSHVLSEVETLCEEVAVLADGQLRTAGSVDDLRASHDEDVTVRVRLADPSAFESARAVMAEHDCPLVRQEGRTFEVACPPGGVLALLDALDDRVAVDGFEVREPGLDRVFERAVSPEASS